MRLVWKPSGVTRLVAAARVDAGVDLGCGRHGDGQQQHGGRFVGDEFGHERGQRINECEYRERAEAEGCIHEQRRNRFRRAGLFHRASEAERGGERDERAPIDGAARLAG